MAEGATSRGSSRGVTVAGMSCDPRCEGAYGPHCECPCGGVNHGGLWAKSGTVLADALAAYRADMAKREAKCQAKQAADGHSTALRDQGDRGTSYTHVSEIGASR